MTSSAARPRPSDRLVGVLDAGSFKTVCLIATVGVQNALDTPLRLFNEDMAAPKKPGGVLRFALAEGFFPVLPWLAFFMAGLLAGRWLLAGRADMAVVSARLNHGAELEYQQRLGSRTVAR